MVSLSKHKWNRHCLYLFLVEDNSILQLSLSEKLKLLGCEVAPAKSGEEEVEKFTPDFDGALMGLGLPGMSGYDATKEIRKIYPYSQTQIIASTTQDASCEKHCRRVGMDGFLKKPLDENQMTTFLTALAKKQRHE